MRAAAGVSCFEPKKTGTTVRHAERGDCSTNGDGSQGEIRLTGGSNECWAVLVGSNGATTPAEELNNRNCEDLMHAATGVSCFEPKKTEQLCGVPNGAIVRLTVTEVTGNFG